MDTCPNSLPPNTLRSLTWVVCQRKKPCSDALPGTKRIVSETVSKIIMNGKAITNETTEPKQAKKRGFLRSVTGLRTSGGSEVTTIDVFYSWPLHSSNVKLTL